MKVMSALNHKCFRVNITFQALEQKFQNELPFFIWPFDGSADFCFLDVDGLDSLASEISAFKLRFFVAFLSALAFARLIERLHT